MPGGGFDSRPQVGWTPERIARRASIRTLLPDGQARDAGLPPPPIPPTITLRNRGLSRAQQGKP